MINENVRIQETAYYLWESEGQPTGQEKRHWELARQMVSADDSLVNGPHANELPPQETSGAAPEEKPRRRTRNITGQTPKARASSAKKPTIPRAKKSTK